MGLMVRSADGARRATGFLDRPINPRSILAFAIGCCAPIPFRLIGVMYGGELLMLVLASWVILTRLGRDKFWSPVAVRFVGLLILGVVSYVATDMIRGTPSENYIRGWSRMVFITTNFIALYYLFNKNSSALLSFFLGFKAVAIVLFFVNPPSYNNFFAQWKYELSAPVTIVCLCLLAMAGKTGLRVSPYVLAVLGAVHVVLDYRSLGLACFIVSAVLLAAKRKRDGKIRIDKRVLIVTSIICGAAVAYLYIASQNQYADRRSVSNSWRFGTTVATLKGIARSPIIGNGSWSSDDEIEAWRDEAMGVSRIVQGTERFTGHSEILEGWYEGGILAEIFFLYYGFQLARVLKLLLQRPVDNLSALFLLMTLSAAWSLFFSPLNGFTRLDVASAMGIFCYLLAEQRNIRIRATRVPAYQSSYPGVNLAATPLRGRG